MRGRRGAGCTDAALAERPEGKHRGALTFELSGTLFTLAVRVAVLQILNTDPRGNRARGPPSPRDSAPSLQLAVGFGAGETPGARISSSPSRVVS